MKGCHDALLSEQCIEYQECDHYMEFATAGKPVLLAEYKKALYTDDSDKGMCAIAAKSKY